MLVNKTDLPAVNEKKQLCARIKLRSGTQIDIDKEGRVSIKNLNININEGSVDIEDPDIALGLEINNAVLGNRGQHIAREHDEVTIPIGISRLSEKDHNGLMIKNTENLVTLQTLAAAFMSPMGPCFLNPSLLSDGLQITGEVTEGSTKVILGDS